MMIITAKVQWKKLILVVVAAAAIILAAVLMGTGVISFEGEDSASAFSTKSGKDDASRVAYLTSLGWEVSETALSAEDIYIPEELAEATYGDYLALQEEAGFDLTKYAGKTVIRYTYEVLNYPTGESGVVAGLLVYKDKIIGGEVMSVQLDGFIQSLIYPTE